MLGSILRAGEMGKRGLSRARPTLPVPPCAEARRPCETRTRLRLAAERAARHHLHPAIWRLCGCYSREVSLEFLVPPGGAQILDSSGDRPFVGIRDSLPLRCRL